MKALVLLIAIANPGSTEPDAKAVFDRALAQFEVGAFEEALPGFMKAYEATEFDDILFNIAQCHRNLGNLSQAIFFFERYLESPNASSKDSVRISIRELEAQLKRERAAAATTTITAAPPPIEVAIPPPSTPTPVVETWWFWTIVGVSVVAAAGGVWAGVASADGDDRTTLDYRDL